MTAKLGSSKEEDRARLTTLFEEMAAASGGRLRVAFNEGNESAKKDKGAAHFMKLDGHRLSRDIELYAFMGNVQGWPSTVVDLGTEVVFAIKDIPESHRIGVAKLKEFGREVMEADKAAEWEALVDEVSAPSSPSP